MREEANTLDGRGRLREPGDDRESARATFNRACQELDYDYDEEMAPNHATMASVNVLDDKTSAAQLRDKVNVSLIDEHEAGRVIGAMKAIKTSDRRWRYRRSNLRNVGISDWSKPHHGRSDDTTRC